MQTIHLTHQDGSTAEITPHGAHLLSWKTGDGKERLYLSQRADYGEGAAIRGGVPVIFPQFSGPPPMRHGFARNLVWDLAHHESTTTTFELFDTEETRIRWPHAFGLEMQFTLGANHLTMELRITNRGDLPFQCTNSLHSYFRVDSISQAIVHGLHGRPYWDEVNKRESTQPEKELRLQGKVDRVYHGAAPLDLSLDAGLNSLSFVTEGFNDIVVWNPGPGTEGLLSDLDPDGYRNFVCVEAVSFHPIEVAPEETWVGSQAVIVKSC